MNYNIIVSSRAKSDIFQTVDYLYNKWSKQEALYFIKKFEEIKLQLSISPLIFPKFNKKKGIHIAVLTKHNTIYYKIDETTREINIITVFNVFQNPTKLNI
ncbi:type II toxin-antitoxin system RelE/ParE family toxin [Lutibacter sp.]